MTFQVVYVTATLPYAFLIAILAYGCTLPGAIDGIKFFFIPDWEQLKDINVSVKCPMSLQPYELGPFAGGCMS